MGDDEHARCNQHHDNSSPLPDRVLDLRPYGDEEAISLHISHPGEVGKYAALSHCWGKTQSFDWTTTTVNFQHRIDSIPQPLPKTFQDAVQITRALGIRYLWIDSYCIIQDSPEDWHAQAPQMAHVYGNSYVTLSADAAENSTAGFLPGSTRSIHTTHEVHFNDGGRMDTLLVRERCPVIYDLPLHDWDVSPSPRQRRHRSIYLKPEFRPGRAPRSLLSSRAWAFQERVLSPRTLHFGRAEVGWECRSLTDCECTPTIPADRTSHYPNLKDAVTTMKWKDVVVRYTSLDISYSEDRLVAISGLASARQKITNDTYVAGVWLSTIKNELMWRRKSFARGNRLDIAPTWSWASITAPVYFDFIITYYMDEEFKEGFSVELILNVDTPTKPFEARARITLLLEGPLVPLSIETVYEDPSTGLTRSRMYPRDTTGCRERLREAGHYGIKWDLGDANDGNYTLFIVACSRMSFQGLILVPTQDEGAYTRLGIVSTPQNWYSNPDLDMFIQDWKRNSVRQLFRLL